MKVCKNCRRPTKKGQLGDDVHDDDTRFCNPGSRAYDCEPVDEADLQPDRRPTYVYVASSWRCAMQQGVIHILKAAGIDAYDFRNPPSGKGFGWQEVMPSFDVDLQVADKDEYLAGLEHPRAVEGFASDMAAMEKADCFVLVLPCGKSAHLELGWAVGQGKRTAVLLDSDEQGHVQPELMYKMVDYVAPNVHALLGWLGVED